jgi:hypothetical protein
MMPPHWWQTLFADIYAPLRFEVARPSHFAFCFPLIDRASSEVINPFWRGWRLSPSKQAHSARRLWMLRNNQTVGELSSMDGAAIPSASGRPAPRQQQGGLVRWAPAAGAWLLGAHYVYQLDPEHARLYLIVTFFMAVAYNLSRRQRRDGEKSAYAMCNKDGERIDGDMSLSNFGLKDVSKPKAPAPAASSTTSRDSTSGGSEAFTDVLGVHPMSTLGRYETALLRPVFKDDAGAFRRYLGILAAPSSRHKLHSKCPCGSGKRFSGCCSELQIFLRQTKYSES